jgi:hypothetical protein
MKRPVIALVTCIALALCVFVPSVRAAETEPEARPFIQMAILLDTSGSMSGLISQAKTELWKVVNGFATTKKDGRIPRLEVALYEYGHSPLGKNQMRMIVPLTGDLDRISEELFALKTNGGNEYCGMVIGKATKELEWSDSNEDLKVIFIAGNEPFTQGPVDYREACKGAISGGIMINTIHCGDEQQGISGKWKDGAMLADGSYSFIDQNRQVVHIEAPQDSKIAELGRQLNETYIAYGARGREARERQEAQDANAAKLKSSGAALQRTVTKANAQYINANWDLVDAVQNDKVKLEELEKEALPEEMRDMSAEERKAHVEKNARRRAELREQINVLNAERKKFVAEKRRELSEADEETLGEALSATLRKQAARKGFEN